MSRTARERALAIALFGLVQTAPFAVVDRAGASDAQPYATNDGNTATAGAVAQQNASAGNAAPRSSGQAGPAVNCSYHAPIAIIARALPATNPVAGNHYLLYCKEAGTGSVVVDQYVQYNPGVTPQVLVDTARQRAEAQLDPPDPTMRTNPPAGDQLVGVPTWLWIDDPWQPVSATATVGPVSSTVTATPRDVRWDLGDGNTITCDGPGRAYDLTKDPASQQSDCAHTYTHRSTVRGPSAAYGLRATVTYGVTWTATTGQNGNLGTISRSSTVNLIVREAQALIR